MARLWACAFSATIAIVLLGAAEASAADGEQPLTPKIVATSPSSSLLAPAISTTPLVSGEAEPVGGVTTSALGLGSDRSELFAARVLENPDYEIVVYAGVGCVGGAVVGSDSAEAFESPGIAVTVPADAETKLWVEQVDPDSESRSDCSASFFPYWEGNVPVVGGSGDGTGGSGDGGASGGQPAGGSSGGGPQAGVDPAVTTGKPDAPRIHVSPGGVANDNSPLVMGNAPGAGSVSIFASDNCSGAAVAKGSAAELAGGLAVQVADNTTTTFSANAMGGQRSACSSSVTFVEDSTAPRTRVTMGPGRKTRKRKAVFRFADVAGEVPGTNFFCKVNRRKWRACSSPLRLKRLRPRRYVVRFRAVDLAGNVEKRGARRIFAVVRGS